jgi:hypothetical protein
MKTIDIGKPNISKFSRNSLIMKLWMTDKYNDENINEIEQ